MDKCLNYEEYEKTMEWIRGALARGYCAPENEKKVLDPYLCEAMAREVEKEVNVRFGQGEIK